MITTYHSTQRTPLREALIEQAQRINGKHDITFAFNARYSHEAAVAALKRWDRMMLNRLFRSRASAPQGDLYEFVVFPEYGALHIHFHGVIRVPPTHLAHFARIASARWKACVPTGNLHFRQMGQTEDDYRRYFDYITKSSTAAEFVHSAFLRTH